MDHDQFWEQELLRADRDMLFSCFIDNPKGIAVYSSTVKGIRTSQYTIQHI